MGSIAAIMVYLRARHIRSKNLSPPKLPEGGRGFPSVEHFLVDDVVADRFAVEDAENVLDGGDAHAVDRLAGDASDVRGGDEVRQGEERVVLRGRLLVEDVERGAGDAVRLQHVVERLLVDDAAARGVDDKGGALHMREPRRVEEAGRLLC